MAGTWVVSRSAANAPLVETEVEIEAEGASLRRFHHHLSVRWTALFWEESLLQSQLHVFGIESPGFQRRRSRYPINPSCGFAAGRLA